MVAIKFAGGLLTVRFLIEKRLVVDAMGLNFIEKINTYNDLRINLQQIDSIIIFDNNLLEVETLKNKFNKEFFLIKTQKSIKEYIYFKKLKKNEQILAVINLNDDYNFCKKVIDTLRKLTENTRVLNISCYIIKNGSKYSNDIDNCIQALCIAEKKARYEYIYDTMCEFLDKQFTKCNFCDFKNDKCIANRMHRIGFESMGCCHSFEYANAFSFKLLKNIKICDYLKDRKCTTQNISCKLFTCGYLKSKKIEFNTHKILLLDCFLNKKQHDIVTLNFFRSREEILQKLMEENTENYLWFLMKKNYLVK